MRQVAEIARQIDRRYLLGNRNPFAHWLNCITIEKDDGGYYLVVYSRTKAVPDIEQRIIAKMSKPFRVEFRTMGSLC